RPEMAGCLGERPVETECAGADAMPHRTCDGAFRDISLTAEKMEEPLNDAIIFQVFINHEALERLCCPGDAFRQSGFFDDMAEQSVGGKGMRPKKGLGVLP